MRSILLFVTTLCGALLLTGCKKEAASQVKAVAYNEVSHAKGFSLVRYKGYTVVKVNNPWPKATQSYTYILKEKNAIVPDSLQQFTTIAVPVKRIVVTSTTHIPSLEMLNEEKSLVGFPHLDYISSEKVRHLIDAGKVKELGNNQSLNLEVLIDLQPEVVIGYGLDNSNPSLDKMEHNGLKVVLNGDWNEQTPLGKAEWIKLFGALYGKSDKANALFNTIEKDYMNTLKIVSRVKEQPSILAGDIFEGKWYLPEGNSWGCQLLKEAKGNYIWADTKGTGSLSLSFETVLEKAKNADIWITSGQFGSLKEMTSSNPHYAQFKAFQEKNVYSFAGKKGKTGGVLYYELAPNRPDLVLKDIVKVLHPELLVGYKLFFFEKLK
ncbi:ABC transporter substrate-binding protein [Flavobacterium sp. SUN046]|uniref:ABC transporter substrate-binding protein n=1 Tax=Flavobacterium sp. SUN046 TaxID=3002440 RepID=UPI002DC002EB|nr:ABC transporter substrate-binding protein [Flavobacterium sp. SUN046]MEC4050626.1 ABC transporter substrate-binding protein [Flavobacterium sp. SUN046]